MRRHLADLRFVFKKTLSAEHLIYVKIKFVSASHIIIGILSIKTKTGCPLCVYTLYKIDCRSHRGSKNILVFRYFFQENLDLIRLDNLKFGNTFLRFFVSFEDTEMADYILKFPF